MCSSCSAQWPRIEVSSTVYRTWCVWQVADTGSTARFECTASDGRAALAWLHDGAAAGVGAALTLRGVARAHRGVYQCVARRDHDSAQAAAELRLGGQCEPASYTSIA